MSDEPSPWRVGVTSGVVVLFLLAVRHVPGPWDSLLGIAGVLVLVWFAERGRRS